MCTFRNYLMTFSSDVVLLTFDIQLLQCSQEVHPIDIVRTHEDYCSNLSRFRGRLLRMKLPPFFETFYECTTAALRPYDPVYVAF